MKKPSLSIIIPVLNEQESIGYVLEDTFKNLPQIVRDFEIIVINDGSTDGTQEVVDAFVKKNKGVRLINQRNRGFSWAVVRGIKEARKDYVTYIQGDGQDLVRDLVNCFRTMDGYDLVLGIRGKRIDYDFYRLILSYGCLFLYRILFGITHEDVHWSYVWKRKEIQKTHLNPDGGIFILVESLIRFKRRGLRIGEKHSPYRPRYAGAGSSTSPKTLWKTLVSVFKLWWKILQGKV